MTKITLRQTTSEERQQAQSWELWESGDTDRFEYQYTEDVEFIVQEGQAVISSEDNEPVTIAPRCHVTIQEGVYGKWAISSPIVNRYRYLTNG